MRRLNAVRAVVISLLLSASLATGQDPDAISVGLRGNQYDLAADGRTFLLKEAGSVTFFMLGELHGDNETPALIRSLWPAMWRLGYRHIAAELSPWAATRLEFKTEGQDNSLPRSFSWSRSDASFVAAQRTGQNAVLWGCDMEEPRPDALIRELASANPANSELQSAVMLTKAGYQRAAAPQLREHLLKAGTINDPSIGGVSLRASALSTLEIEIDRMSPDMRLRASARRESLMKDLFHKYWQTDRGPKVMLRFGANHLFRGIDRRGVSTLGNFVAELAFANGQEVFNVAELAGGGKIAWGGQIIDFPGQLDDPALAFLASIARYPATVFDLRAVRQALHRIDESRRSSRESSLIYWADSYDAIIYYRTLTPAQP
jgi:hypothetical protein